MKGLKCFDCKDGCHPPEMPKKQGTVPPPAGSVVEETRARRGAYWACVIRPFVFFLLRNALVKRW